jgi:hypothetical protein
VTEPALGRFRLAPVSAGAEPDPLAMVMMVTVWL